MLKVESCVCVCGSTLYCFLAIGVGNYPLYKSIVIREIETCFTGYYWYTPRSIIANICTCTCCAYSIAMGILCMYSSTCTCMGVVSIS